MDRPTFAALAALVALGCGGSTGTEPGTGTGTGTTGGTGARPASLQIVSGDTQVGAVGTELSAPLVVRVLDASGAPVVGQAINFRVVEGGGSVFAGVGTTSASGVAQERWTLGTVPGPQRVEARAVDSTTGAALVFGTFTATAVAGAPATIVILSGDQQAGQASTALPIPPTVRVRDAYANPVAGATVTFVVTSGGGSASPALAVTDSTGKASTAWTLGPTAGPQALEARAGTANPASFVAAVAGTPSQFQGAWVQCAAAGTSSSQKMVLVISGGSLTLAISSYGSSACTGTPTVTTTGTGTVVTGATVSVPLGGGWVTAYQMDLQLRVNGSATALYTLGYVSADTPPRLYMGDASGATDGFTPARRPTTLDTVNWFVPLSPLTDVTIYWQFQDMDGNVFGDYTATSPGCGIANVDQVRVTLTGPGGSHVQTVPCVAVNGVPGATLTSLASGTYTMELEGLRLGLKVFGMQGSGPIENSPALYGHLQATYPNMDLWYELPPGASCVGVSEIAFELDNLDGGVVEYSSANALVACRPPPNNGFTMPSIPTGNYGYRLVEALPAAGPPLFKACGVGLPPAPPLVQAPPPGSAYTVSLLLGDASYCP